MPRASAQLSGRFTNVSSIVVATPSAQPESPPKLVLMSWRTTPSCPRTFGPLEPSAGHGPAVSAGIAFAHAASAAVDGAADDVVGDRRFDAVAPPGLLLDLPEHAATTAEAPATPAS